MRSPARRFLFELGLFVSIASIALLSTRTAALPPESLAPVAYRISVPEPYQRWLAVEVIFSEVNAPLEIRMSRFSPGRYSAHEFERNVFDVRATTGRGQPISLDHPAPWAWRAVTDDGIVRLTYKVYGDSVDGTSLAVDSTHAHVNVPAALVWAEGHEWRPATITCVPPPGSDWRIATQLLATADPLVFTAPNYQYLADSPIEMSNHVRRTFDAPLPPGATGPAPTIALALHHTGSDADVDAFAADLRRIVAEAAAVFGEYPAYEGGQYTFLADYLPWASGDGMEHRNSTVLTSSQSIAASRARLIDTAAHEFFHGWNVERIRPRSLEPFDFGRPNISGELWLAEGVTSYYENLIVHRAGLSPLDQLLRDLGATVDAVVTSPAHAFHSVADMSRMALLVDGARSPARTNLSNTFISYYTYGAALGLGLDLAIRAHTSGTRSLDDLMAALWRDFGRVAPERIGTVSTPYTIEDVTARLGTLLGDAALADTWVARYVEGRDVMDYGSLLAPAGLRLQKRFAGRASLGLASFDRSGNALSLGAPPPIGSPFEAAKLGEDDGLLALNGQALDDFSDFENALERVRPGELVTLRVRRRGSANVDTVRVRAIEDPRVQIVTTEAGGGRLSDDQRRFREAWLGSKSR